MFESCTGIQNNNIKQYIWCHDPGGICGKTIQKIYSELRKIFRELEWLWGEYANLWYEKLPMRVEGVNDWKYEILYLKNKTFAYIKCTKWRGYNYKNDTIKGKYLWG